MNLRPKSERNRAEPRDRQAVRARHCSRSRTRYGARIKVAEVPPGPPVLETLVAEVYGPNYRSGRSTIARQVRDLFKQTDGVVDVDWYVEDDQPEISAASWTRKKPRSTASPRTTSRARCGSRRRAKRPGCCTSIARKKTSRSRLRLDRADALRPRSSSRPEDRRTATALWFRWASW